MRQRSDMRHVVLIGLSGSGKSTLGRRVAEELDMPLADIDLAIEKRAGMPIRRIFELHGEEFFRDMEARELCEALASETLSVIAAGGGIVLRRENVQGMRENGFVVFLDRPVERIIKDILHDDARPLVTGADKLYEMERKRRAFYLDAADAVLKNDAGLEEALSGLTELIRSGLVTEYEITKERLTK